MSAGRGDAADRPASEVTVAALSDHPQDGAVAVSRSGDRILLVHDGHGELRGSERVILALLDGLDHERFTWVVLTNHPKLAEACRARGIATEQYPFRMLFTAGVKPNDLAAFCRFAVMAMRTVRKYRISLIHANNGGACAWLLPAALVFGVPLLVHIHNRWSRKMQLILGLHHADRIVGVCHGIMQDFYDDPAAASRATVVYNGLDGLSGVRQDRAGARAALGLAPDAVVIGLIAALVPAKRVDLAIAAMRQLAPEAAQRATLLVVGDGPGRSALEQSAAGLPVIFTGHRDDVHDLLLNVIDIVILPSDSEAFSIVLLEAAAAALPRIGTRVGGIPESIVDGVDGCLVAPHDSAALAAAMQDLILDPEKAQRYGAAAAARLKREFSVQMFVDRFAAIYDEMAGSPPRSRGSRLLSAVRSIWVQLTGRRRRSRTPRGQAPQRLAASH